MTLMRLMWTGLLAMAAAWPQGDPSRACAACHQEIWRTYQQTGMGRAFYRPTAANTGTGTYYHAASESWFSVLERDGRFYQRRHQVDENGKPTNVMEKAIDYIMGSGNRARTFLSRTANGGLVELPLGWYSEKGGYFAMNPGYDRPDHDGFRRPITHDCMFCHNSYPRPQAANAAEHTYADPLPLGIGCDRCHGDGTRHMQLAAGKGAAPAQVRQAIVNPKRLANDRQLELCMSCHLETTSFPLPNALLRFGRGVFSYRPGEPLADYILNFDHPASAGRGDKFEIVNAAYRMRKSACYLQSKGAMTCTTCHDPHRPATADNQSCRQCHNASHQPPGQCADCHMPKRRTEDVIHAVATDHLIQRRPPPGDLLAELAERRDDYRGPVVPYYPAQLPGDDLYLAVAQVKQRSNLAAGIQQLTQAINKQKPARAEWYTELADALGQHGQPVQAIAWYREALRRDPGNAATWQRLGTALRRARQPAESTQALARAVTLAPQDAVAWHEAGLTHQAANRPAEARQALEKAVQLDPDFPEAHNNLGLLRLQEPQTAEQAFREAIRIKPDYADAHANLAQLLAQINRPADARRAFERALRLRPHDAPTRYGFAMLLGRGREYAEAQRQLEQATKTNPDFADAHELLADLLLVQQQPQRAATHYRETLRLRPGAAGAQLGLGTALASLGDRAGARVSLEQAARSTDPAIRSRAQEILRQLSSEIR